MPNSAGYLQLRRGLFEHVRNGRLSHAEALVFIYITAQADSRTGIWIGSAGALAGELGIPVRTAARLLESLTKKRYLRRFTKPGAHYCYPILVHKYLVTDGEHVGELLNALATMNWRAPVYDRNSRSREHPGEQPGEQLAGQREIRSENREKKASSVPARTPSPTGASLASFLRQRIFDNNPTARITDAQMRKWGVEADLMMRQDRRTEMQIREVIDWCQRDSFWQANILSMGKLREKFDQLTLKMRAGCGGLNHGTTSAKEYGNGGGYGKAPLAKHSQSVGVPLKESIIGGPDGSATY